MKNLEQIRAAGAIEPAKKLDKSAVNKLPAMIMSNGLLATIAFCHSEGGGSNRSHMVEALKATASHLAKAGLTGKDVSGLESFAKDLSQRNSIDLQRATEEALAFIGYLRRFASKD